MINAWSVPVIQTPIINMLQLSVRRAISRDPDVYPEPDAFKPERFLTQNGGVSDLNDPKKFVFGFGRRWVCVASADEFQVSLPNIAEFALVDTSPTPQYGSLRLALRRPWISALR